MIKWNVLYENFNKKKIESYNIFQNTAFTKDCLKACKKYTNDREKFLEEVKRSLMYYFWAKCEWEIIVTGWPQREGVEAKIDVYDQVRMNWDRFADYIWENRKELKREIHN